MTATMTPESGSRQLTTDRVNREAQYACLVPRFSTTNAGARQELARRIAGVNDMIAVLVEHGHDSTVDRAFSRTDEMRCGGFDIIATDAVLLDCESKDAAGEKDMVAYILHRSDAAAKVLMASAMREIVAKQTLIRALRCTHPSIK